MQPSIGKGDTAEVNRVCMGRGIWAAGEYPSDCHSNVEGYRKIGRVFLYFLLYFTGSLP